MQIFQLFTIRIYLFITSPDSVYTKIYFILHFYNITNYTNIIEETIISKYLFICYLPSTSTEPYIINKAINHIFYVLYIMIEGLSTNINNIWVQITIWMRKLISSWYWCFRRHYLVNLFCLV